MLLVCLEVVDMSAILDIRLQISIISDILDILDIVSQLVLSVETKHLKKSNAACFYTPVVLKLLIIVQM